jgi:hypothetical protein
LFREKEDLLTHKVLICGERKHAQDDATRDANMMIRQLLSEKRIMRMLCVPDGNSWKTERQERKGPVAYAESTTAGSIFAEDLNRMVQVYLDDTEDQTRSVMLAAARKYAPDRPEVDVEAVVRKHHEFQSSLQPCRVIIPYAEDLAMRMSAERCESRRVMQQVLTVIEGITLLHQHRRNKDGQDRLVAEVTDYALARRLLLGPLHAAIGGGEGYAKYARLRARLPQREFDSNEALKAAFKSKTTCYRTLKRMEDLGLLKCVSEGSSHAPARWAWTDKHPDELVLPKSESLFVASFH